GSGIIFNTGGALHVEECLLRKFTGSGIQFMPTVASALYVSDTVLADNASVGMSIFNQSTGTVVVALERVQILNGGIDGLDVSTLNSGASTNVSLSRSVVSGNGGTGVYANRNLGPLSATVFVRDSTVSGNATGIFADQGTTIYLGHSLIQGN